MFVDKITIDFPIFLLFFNTKFPIFPIFSILSFLFSYFFEQPCRWTPCALSHSDFTLSDTKGDWRPIRPPNRVSRVPDYLILIQSVLGLSQVRLIPHIFL